MPQWPPARLLIFSKEIDHVFLVIRAFKLVVALICVQALQHIPKAVLDISVPTPVCVTLECDSCIY